MQDSGDGHDLARQYYLPPPEKKSTESMKKRSNISESWLISCGARQQGKQKQREMFCRASFG